MSPAVGGRASAPRGRGPLSVGALRLLSVLREAGARCPATAVTHARAAAAAGLPQRWVIDFAGELLDAGYLVLAGSSGIFLVEPGGSRSAPGDGLAAARAYAASLRHRARMVLRRRRRVLRAVELVESGRAPGCDGMPLFTLCHEVNR